MQGIERVTEDHLNFICKEGERHIRQKSFDYYSLRDAANNVLLEYRIKEELIGISFARVCSEDQFSITVVAHQFRRSGIGTKLVLEKQKRLAAIGIQLHPIISPSNIASVSLYNRVKNNVE